MSAGRILKPEPLTAAAFSLYGEVIAADDGIAHAINAGTSRRFDDLASIDTEAEGGRARLSLFRTEGRPLPLRIELMERHPLGSQAFLPRDRMRFLVLVADGDAFDADALRAFVTDGRQGVNLRRALWHHPLCAIDSGELVVIDRTGPGIETELHQVDEPRPVIEGPLP